MTGRAGVAVFRKMLQVTRYVFRVTRNKEASIKEFGTQLS
jgi:hypothetical protein